MFPVFTVGSQFGVESALFWFFFGCSSSSRVGGNEESPFFAYGVRLKPQVRGQVVHRIIFGKKRWNLGDGLGFPLKWWRQPNRYPRSLPLYLRFKTLSPLGWYIVSSWVEKRRYRALFGLGGKMRVFRGRWLSPSPTRKIPHTPLKESPYPVYFLLLVFCF